MCHLNWGLHAFGGISDTGSVVSVGFRVGLAVGVIACGLASSTAVTVQATAGTGKPVGFRVATSQAEAGIHGAAVMERAGGGLVVSGANRSVVASWPRQRATKGLRIAIRGHKVDRRSGREMRGWAGWSTARQLRPDSTRHVFTGLRNGRQYQVKLDVKRGGRWRSWASGVAVAKASGSGPSPSPGSPVSIGELERQVLDLTNSARSQGRMCGSEFMPAVASLQWDDALGSAARAHSADMATRGYFAHETPEGKTPWQRIDEAGVRPWVGAGENIALGYSTPSEVVDGWIDSPGHCQNLMGNFDYLGVGVATAAGTGRRYWTQDFILSASSR